MSKRLGKLGLLALEGTAVAVALLAGLAAFAHWKVSHGGLPLDLLKPFITASLEERLAEGRRVSVGGILLQRDVPEGEGDGPLRLLTEDLVVTDGDGTKVLEFPELAFELSTQDLLRGSLRPRFVDISDAAISVTRTSAGALDLGFTGEGSQGDSNMVANLLAAEGEDKPGAGLFEGARLTGLRFEFIDELTGQTWLAEDADARLSRASDGYRATLNAPFSLDGTPADLQLAASLSETREEVSIYLYTDKTPVAGLLEMVVGPELSGLVTAELTGSVETVTDYNGNMKRARVDVTSEGGSISLPGRTIDFNSIALQADYEPVSRRFDIAHLIYDAAGNSGTLAGFVSLGEIPEEGTLQPEAIEFSIEGADLTVAAPGFLPDSLPVEDLVLAGVFNFPENQLRVDDLSIGYFGEKITGTLALLLPEEAGQSPGVKAEAVITGSLSPSEILAGWPLTVATGVRDWVEGSLPAASARNVRFVMDMPRGAILPGQALKDEFMTLTFSVRDATAYYIPGMTPLKGVNGEGVVTGNSFNLKTSGGRIGTVDILSGEVDMPAFFPRRGPGYYRADLRGDIQEVMSIINEEPLRFIEKGGFSPDNFTGRGTFSFDIMRPMRSVAPLELYEFNGTGTFAGLGVENIIAGYEVSGGAGSVNLKTDSLEVSGEASLEGAPVRFVWQRQFDDSERTQITASGVVDALAADNFGFSLRQLLRGNVNYDVSLLQEQGAYQSARLQLDLADTELTLDQIDWRKARGTSGLLEVSVQFPQGPEGQGVWQFDRINLDTEGMTLAATAFLDSRGGFIEAALEKLYIEDRASLRASLKRIEDTLKVNVTGAYANLNIFNNLLGGNDPDAESSGIPGKTDIVIDLDRFDMRDGISLLDFDASISHDGAQITTAKLDGSINEGGSVTVALQQTGEQQISRRLEASTDNLGSLLRGFFGITSVEQGEARYSASELTNGPFAGTLTAGNFRVANTPLLARIFSAGSLTGLNDLLSGEGIGIDSVAADLQFDEGVLSIVDARATGPSIGLSVGGDVDFVLDSFDINGAFAPAYQVNSALGQLPGIGDLLVSRRGEGVVAFSYGIDGPVSEPVVTVNALSLLTPGIFRRIFEPVRASRKSTAELLEEAVEAAELADQLEVTTTAEQLQELEQNIDKLGLPPEPDPATDPSAPDLQ